MFKLLLIRFAIKFYAIVSILKHTKKKYGQDIIRTARKLENLIIEQAKIQLDIKFVNTCKKEQLISTFAKVNLTIKDRSQQLN